MNTDGDCFQVAGRYVLDHPTLSKDVYAFVHGIVNGQGPLSGLAFTHAWIERDGNVIDHSNGRKIEMPIELYYTLGGIKTTVRYTPREAANKMLESGHYGAWDMPETEQELFLKRIHKHGHTSS